MIKFESMFPDRGFNEPYCLGAYDVDVEIQHRAWVTERMQQLEAAAQASGCPRAFYISLAIFVMELIGDRTIHPRGLGYEAFHTHVRDPWREYEGSKVERARLLTLLHQELTHCVAKPIEAMWLGEVVAGPIAS